MTNGLPSREDISPTLGLNLDERSALKNFFGKTLSEAQELFALNALTYGEDIFWMGQKGFQFYFQSFENYVMSDEANEDYLAILALVSILEFRIGTLQEEWVWPVVASCVKYCINHFEKFCFGEEAESYERVLFTYHQKYGECS